MCNLIYDKLIDVNSFPFSKNYTDCKTERWTEEGLLEGSCGTCQRMYVRNYIPVLQLNCRNVNIFEVSWPGLVLVHIEV